MSIWTTIKKIFTNGEDIEIDSEIKAGVDNNDLKVTGLDFSSQGNKKVIVKKGGSLTINLLNCDSKEKDALIKEIISPNIASGGQLLEKKVEEKKEKIAKNIPPEESDEEVTLEFYKDKLSPEYYDALDMALIIRRIAKNGGEIRDLKSDVVRKYPQFGGNLCNLVSEDYFDRYFKNLYEDMKEAAEFETKDYTREVERIVASLPFILFVSENDKVENILAKVIPKIIRLKKYGTHRFILHGLGKSNVDKIKDVLSEIENKTDDVTYDAALTTTRAKVTLIF